jgi:hypothetical protein
MTKAKKTRNKRCWPAIVKGGGESLSGDSAALVAWDNYSDKKLRRCTAVAPRQAVGDLGVSIELPEGQLTGIGLASILQLLEASLKAGLTRAGTLTTPAGPAAKSDPLPYLLEVEHVRWSGSCRAEFTIRSSSLPDGASRELVARALVVSAMFTRRLRCWRWCEYPGWMVSTTYGDDKKGRKETNAPKLKSVDLNEIPIGVCVRVVDLTPRRSKTDRSAGRSAGCDCGNAGSTCQRCNSCRGCCRC